MKTYWLVMGTRVSSVIKSSIRVLVTDEDMLFIEPALQRLIRRNPTFGITMIERKDEESNGVKGHQRKKGKHLPRRGPASRRVRYSDLPPNTHRRKVGKARTPKRVPDASRQEPGQNPKKGKACYQHP